MIFNTPWFLAFFVLLYALLWALPGARGRYWAVLAASAVFHAHFAGRAGVLPIVVMGTLVYFLAFRLDAARGAARRRWLTVGLLVPVLGLAYYKYRVFLCDSLVALWPGAGAWLDAWMRPRPMPLAISFFTFEFVHYLVEVYRGGAPIRRWHRFALFCVYFPSIVSGPIKRYRDFQAQVERGLPHPRRAPQGAEGAAQLLTGFFKKLVLADNLAVVIGQMDLQPGWGRWQVVLLMGLLCARIVFDFSGYSDMALGLSKLLGLRLPDNFNSPYLALNPSDFWRRWHMSLSSWIRDYIYIPLGGSRQGALRRAANGLAAMALCGLWHGAAWNFVLWGLYHGAGLAVWGAWDRSVRFVRDGWAYRSAAWAACLAFVAYGWIWFFYPLGRAWELTRILLHGA